VARGVAGWPSVWASRDGLLNSQGVDRATVGATAALKIQNLLQMVAAIVLTIGDSRRPWLELTAAAVFTVSGLVLLVVAVRAQRLPRAAVAVDVSVAVAVLLVAPLFQPVGPVQPWFDWPLLVAFLVAAEASACFSLTLACAATLCLMGAAASWLRGASPAGPAATLVAARAEALSPPVSQA